MFFGTRRFCPRAGPALRTLARRAAIPVELEIRTETRPADRIEVAAYYVVSEALTNVTKHACAEHVRIKVAVACGRLEIEVADDGRGFDVGATTAGFGVAGMRERVELSGGRLSVTPSDSGTIVRAQIPLPEGDVDPSEEGMRESGS
ncbi:MAG: hypothetical protein QOF99_404 [Pseudonocardiales bacterium]|nr:hypothetical protein [Pseudonocardiales bacterium]